VHQDAFTLTSKESNIQVKRFTWNFTCAEMQREGRLAEGVDGYFGLAGSTSNSKALLRHLSDLRVIRYASLMVCAGILENLAVFGIDPLDGGFSEQPIFNASFDPQSPGRLEQKVTKISCGAASLSSLSSPLEFALFEQSITFPEQLHTYRLVTQRSDQVAALERSPQQVLDLAGHRSVLLRHNFDRQLQPLRQDAAHQTGP
jgi:hypothetical protein